MKQRIYKYDNVKAILIFLVVVGHLTTDYVGDAHIVRAFTLWIYAFHMPAFIMVSGLLHKKYITDEQAAAGIKGNTAIRWEKVIGFLLCAYGLKIFLQLFRTAIGQHPMWHWIAEPGIPWYLIVMAEYEIVLFIIRRVNWKIMLVISFVISAAVGYFPAIGDTLCLSRMINFLPLFLIGYYIDPKKLIEISKNVKLKIASAILLIAAAVISFAGPWTIYRMRKYFTGRRSYEFLEDWFPGTFSWAWAIRIGVWALAIAMALAIIILAPDKEIKGVTVAGERSLSIYFWHRPICYLLCGIGVYPALVKLLGNSDLLALLVYILIAAAMTWLFSLKIFVHPPNDLTKLGVTIVNLFKKKEA